MSTIPKATSEEVKMSGAWPKIGRGEVLYWRGRQWSVTSRGFDQRRPASLWVPRGAVRKGLLEETFYGPASPVCCLAGNHWVDVEDLIEAIGWAIPAYGIPVTHKDAAIAYMRKVNARAKGRNAEMEVRADAIEAAGGFRWEAGMWMSGDPPPA
jgi:hypothetical protein